jgi:class 3 adenylate cyclase
MLSREQVSDAGSDAAMRDRIHRLRHDLAGLLVLWHERSEPALGWRNTPGVYALLARAFVEVGAPMLGLEVAIEGLQTFPGELPLRQLRGLALARSGHTRDANLALEQLHGEGHLEDETLGLLARTHKDLGLAAVGAAREQHLGAALELYGDAFARHRSYWAGVNVATLATLGGDLETSVAVARQVIEVCQAALRQLPAEHPDRYWALATLGEAVLCTGDLARAEDWYRQAGELGRHRFGDLNSTRRHARLLLEHLGRDPRESHAWLPLPRVVLFSGHMIDRLDRPEPRFPPQLEGPVGRAIRDWLAAENRLIGFSSAACGADLLFLEALQALSGESHIVLPYESEEFAADSVELPGVAGWRSRFDRQLAEARVVYASSSRPLHGGVGYDFANQLVQGLGLLRALELETELEALAVWDGQAADGTGGTASAVGQWLRHGIPVHRVVLQVDAADVHVRPVSAGTPAVVPAARAEDRMMSLLFADAVGFSKLSDREVPLFVEHFLGLVARLVARDAAAIPVRETWGDGLFLAFFRLSDAGLFALDLLDAVAATDWQALGFSRPLTIRLALHAGPVHLATDPVTGLPKCCGTHVSRAARLEPKTPPGQVYASEAFAALAALEGIEAFRCQYVRQIEWAKRYGTFPAYMVQRNVPRPA